MENLSGKNAAMARLLIKEAAKDAGITLEKLAEKVGLSQGYFSRIARGNRPVKLELLEKISRIVKKPVHELYEDGKVPVPSMPTGLTRIIVSGYVQAGNYRPVDEIDEAIEEIQIPLDPRIRSTPVAFKVRGDSYDAFVREGGYVIGFLYGESPGELQKGMTVVAERVRAGDLIERTLKMVSPLRKGSFDLLPRSSNKTHKPIRFPSADDEILTRIYAVITTFVQPADW